MSVKGKNNEKINLKISNKQFEIILKICLIIGIIIISGFIIYYIFTPEPGYVTFGILNEDQEAEDYPTEATVNESIHFYLTVENYLNKKFNFRVKIKKGDNFTVFSTVKGTNGTLDFISDNFTLKSNEKWISEKLNVSFSEVGTNQIIFTELWQIINDFEEKFYSILWLRLNVTA
ncbi:MAG: DUF1616 domain-containing protein [Promethearchaeota archaeon]